MNISKYILLSSVALMAISCQDNTPSQNNKPEPKPCEDVQFGAFLDENAVSRTYYDDETESGFPILWNKGDEVFISSPHALSGKTQATYIVNEEQSEGRDYAGVLAKKGENGIQWHSNPSQKHDFYSIYPSAYVTASNNTSFSINIDDNQRNVVVDLAQPDAKGFTRKASADMTNCFMYAKTFEVNSGETVNLRYKPLSTAIRIILQGPDSQEDAIINNVKLHAPYPIAGDFTVDLENAAPTAQLGEGESWEGVPPTGKPVITL